MPAVDDVRVTTFSVPTDAPESDGTLAWDSTGVVVVEVDAGGVTGLGWTYADAAAGDVARGKLAQALAVIDADDVGAAWMAMRRAVRNDGGAGLAACAISAVDVALWDRFARARGVPLAVALGAYRDTIEVYGSGGFCSYDDARLAEQLGGWAASGMRRVKMKVGADPAADLHRVAVAREAIGDGTELFVDANGAYGRRDAVWWAHAFAGEADVRWLEEPVSSRDRAGLRFVRDQAPPGVAVAAGEYAWGPEDARDLLAAGAVDVLQADATRCGGLTGFRAIGALAAADGVALSAHCSPALHLHACCAVERAAHLEYFHDHVRIEGEIFDGVPVPRDGVLQVDRSRTGHGLTVRREVVERLARDDPG
jgi:L-alanine-DL-glutamate epimerase-like enolase superfamily enzyme